MWVCVRGGDSLDDSLPQRTAGWPEFDARRSFSWLEREASLETKATTLMIDQL